MNCITEKNKAFLLDLVDLAEVIGPRDLEEKCQSKVEEGQECKLEDTVFSHNLKEAALAVAGIPLCEIPEKGD